MRPTVFPLPFHSPAISLMYATTQNVGITRPHYVDKYAMFALCTQVQARFLDGKKEEFVTYMVDMGTEYLAYAHAIGEHNLPLVLSSEQTQQIQKYIHKFFARSGNPWCLVLFTDNAENLVRTYPTNLVLHAHDRAVYVDLTEVDDFMGTYEDLAISLYYSLGHPILPNHPPLSDPSLLTQPLLEPAVLSLA